MSAEVVTVDLVREYRALPKHARGKRILADIAKRERTKQLKAELELEILMRAWAESFFVTREEVGL